ncbi:hypothetical protein AALA82_00025 [Oscillospiraceae bacterium 50-16]
MKALIPVLSSLDICRAISLDDDHVLASKMRNPEFISIDDFFHACNEEFTGDEQNTIEDSGVSTVGELLENMLLPQELKDKVNRVVNSKSEPLAALSFLADGFKESDISYQTLDDVNEVENTSNEGTIWFLDREMGGRDVLPEVVSAISHRYVGGINPCLIVVFTSEDTLMNLNDSWNKRFDFLSQELEIASEISEVLAYSFFVISKKAVIERREKNEQAAICFVEEILINSLIGYCTFNVVAKMRQYSQQAYDCLLTVVKDAQKSTIETIQYNMVKEGEPNIYHSLNTIHSFMQEEQYTKQFDSVEKYILAIKRVTQLKNFQSKRIIKQSIEDIILHHDWAQYQFVHRDTNISYQDISYGDVFRIDNQEHSCIGILITQPCDCVLRTDNDQNTTVRRKANLFTLLVYEGLSCNKANFSGEVHNIHNNGIIYEYELDQEHDNWKISYIDITKRKSVLQVTPAILDLTSMNSDGKSVLLSEEQIKKLVNEKKTQNWEGYMLEFQKNISTIREMIQFLSEKIPGEIDKLEQVLQSIYNVPISLRNQEFLIQRIGHLDTNLVEFASYHYTTHTYRTGKNSLIALHNPNEQGEE